MKTTSQRFFIFLLWTFNSIALFSQELNHDWRYLPNGTLIHSNGYVDQPYILILNDSTWFCAYTTSNQHEGAKGQHVACRTSINKGRTWSEAVKIEEPSQESASWGVPYLTQFGRIYVFYDYNGDKIHQLGSRKNIREDMLGWYCFRYSDDQGKTWSDRYRLPMRKTPIDQMNQWKGDVQIFWGIDKPKRMGNGLLFAFSKIGEYMLEYSEGWLYHCDNIEIEKNPDKLNWKLLPEGDTGIRAVDWGDIQEEQNTVHINDSLIACMYRTTQGHPLMAYSHDQGRSWTTPKPARDYNGRPLKNPRANPKIWKCQNGYYLLWYHHNGTRSFNNRNPSWIAGGIEKEGEIIWTQPEIFLHHDGPGRGPSYPDLVEQEGRYWITETQKVEARTHEIPAAFLNRLWRQFDIAEVTKEKPAIDISGEKLEQTDSLSLPEINPGNAVNGFTLTVRLKSNLDMAKGKIIVDTRDQNGKGFWLQAAEDYTVLFSLSDGIHTSQLRADPGILQTRSRTEQEFTLTVDHSSRIMQFIVDGVVCDGGDSPFGWAKYDEKMVDFGTQWLRIDKTRKTLTEIKFYQRALMNTEVIGEYRYWRHQQP